MENQIVKKKAEITLQSSPEKYYHSLIIRSEVDVLNCNGSQLSGLYKDFGDLKLKAVMTLVLADLINFFSVGKSMDENQIAATVNLILSEYWHFKLEDFKLCFNRAKAGKYGKVYDRIDGGVIMEWIAIYELEKQHYIDNQHDLKKQEKINILDAEIKVNGESKSIKDIPGIAQIGKEKKPEPEEKVLTDQEKQIQAWLNQFEKLFQNHYRKQLERFGIKRKFVYRGSRLLNVDEFLLFKLKQKERVIKRKYLEKYL